jgi:hypothetical protein
MPRPFDDRDHFEVAQWTAVRASLETLDQLSHRSEVIGSLGMSLVAEEPRTWR